MNNEEAIRIFRKEIECLSHAKCEDCILEKVCDPAKTTPLDSEYIEAYGMAIQALEKENIYDDKECYVTISKALYDKLNIDYEQALSQEPCDECRNKRTSFCGNCKEYDEFEQEPMREFTEEEAKAYSKALDKIYKPTGFNVFDGPCDDIVSRGVFEQVMRERDIAIDQLHELGYELGQKIEPCDAISRQAVLDLPRIKTHNVWGNVIKESVDVEDVRQLPSVTQKSGKWLGVDRFPCTEWKCSECDEQIHVEDNPYEYFKYCPNCGCCMVVPQESEGGNDTN